MSHDRCATGNRKQDGCYWTNGELKLETRPLCYWNLYKVCKDFSSIDIAKDIGQ